MSGRERVGIFGGWWLPCSAARNYLLSLTFEMESKVVKPIRHLYNYVLAHFIKVR